MRLRPRAGADAGFVSLELVLGLAVLVLPIALIVLTLPTWLARQNVARLAAEQAARTAVVTLSMDQGRRAAEAVAQDAGVAPPDLQVGFEPGSSVARGGQVVAAVTVRTPAAQIPLLGGVGSFSLTARFAERVDLYRSGP